MGAIFVNDGLLLALNDLIASELANATAHLFTNNYTPVPGSVLADFTEMTGTGYAAITLNAWGTPVLGGDGFYTTANSAITWSNTGGTSWAPAYGWYYLDSTGTKVLSAALFTTPITVAAGGTLPLAPIIACGSEY
jgi:hypothetical protein